MNIKKFIPLLAFMILLSALFVLALQFIGKTALSIKEVNNELIAWQQKGEDMRQLQDVYIEKQGSINIINQALPNNNQVISFFKELENIAGQSGVVLTIDMSALPVRNDQDNIETFLLRLNLKGSYSQIQSFIRNLENLDQLVLVRHIAINMPEGVSGELINNILIKTYFAIK